MGASPLVNQILIVFPQQPDIDALCQENEGRSMEKKKSQPLAIPTGDSNKPGIKSEHETPVLQVALEAYEKQLLLDALHKNLGHRTKTAAMLGIDRKTLYTKLKKYGAI
jgi:DNA-binding NtrC family response regulator